MSTFTLIILTIHFLLIKNKKINHILLTNLFDTTKHFNLPKFQIFETKIFKKSIFRHFQFLTICKLQYKAEIGQQQQKKKHITVRKEKKTPLNSYSMKNA